MEYHLYFFVALSAIVLTLATLAVWSRRGRVARWMAIILCIVIVVGAPVTFTEILSHPKRISEEIVMRYFKKTERARVIAFHFEEGVAIYLWMIPHGLKKPRYYSLPWDAKDPQKSRKLVEKLMELLKDPRGAILSFPFEGSLELDKRIHPIPQPADPPKKEQKPPIHFGS